MTKPSIAFTKLAEKGPDVDLVRDMLQLAAQKLMELDVEALCGAAYGQRADVRENSRNGAPAQSTYVFQSCARVRISPAFWNHVELQKKR